MVGIITIHKINNYGSVLQAYALQRVCEELGFEVEIIDYNYPNAFHAANPYALSEVDSTPNEPRWIKVLFAKALIRQHRGIASFVKNRLHLSSVCYDSPEALEANPPTYDVYITGSDQVWSPRHCKGDPAFMLHFSPDSARKISFAASFGTNDIPEELRPLFHRLLTRYDAIAVRENSGCELVRSLTGKEATVVVDPTLLLNASQWNEIATPRRLVKRKYILCYYLNYSFNAFPYVDELAADIQRQTGYEIVRVARPPHKLSFSGTTYRVGASPEEFLALVRDAEVVLTTSFHGTAFASNYGRPLFTVVKDRNAGDSRQVSLMVNLGMEKNIIELGDKFPEVTRAEYDTAAEQTALESLRSASIAYLRSELTS